MLVLPRKIAWGDPNTFKSLSARVVRCFIEETVKHRRAPGTYMQHVRDPFSNATVSGGFARALHHHHALGASCTSNAKCNGMIQPRGRSRTGTERAVRVTLTTREKPFVA